MTNRKRDFSCFLSQSRKLLEGWNVIILPRNIDSVVIRLLYIRSGQENCFRPFPKKEKEEKSMNHRGKYRAHSKVLRVLAVVLTLSMLLGMSGIQAFAEEDTVAKIPSGAKYRVCSG